MGEAVSEGRFRTIGEAVGRRGTIWAHRSEEGGGGGGARVEVEKKVSSLVGWRYIRQALNALPS